MPKFDVQIQAVKPYVAMVYGVEAANEIAAIRKVQERIEDYAEGADWEPFDETPDALRDFKAVDAQPSDEDEAEGF